MNKGRTFALAWLVAVALLLGHNGYLWLVKRIVPDTDIMALLPVQERDPILQRSFAHMVDAAQQRVIVLVGAAEWGDAKRAADAYAAVLGKRPDLFDTASATDSVQAEWLSLFQRHRLVLMTPAQQEQLRKEGAAFWTQQALAKLYAPFGGPKLGAWQDDPFGLFSGWVQERAQETPVRPRDGHLFVADDEKQYVLLPLTLKVPALSMTAQGQVLPLLGDAVAAAREAAPQARVIQAGVILHAANAGSQASREMHTIGIGSVAGIVLLVWFTFRSLKPIALILLSIGVGVLGALSVCWLLFGQVHLMTLVFGASLVGVAQDYGIYFLCNRLSAPGSLDSRALLKKLLPGLSLTLLAAVIGYAGLAFTPFPGLRQMAVFSALGLVFAWLTVIFWFPQLIGPRSLRGGALVRRYGAVLHRWPRLRANPAAGIAVAAFAIMAVFGIARLGANDDIRLLQNPPKHLVDDQIKLGKLLDAPTPVQFFLVRGDSAETVLQREEALKLRLDGLVAQRKLTGYQALSNWVPSARTQQERRTLVDEKLLGADGPLAAVAHQAGEDDAWVQATAQALRAAGTPLDIDAFLKAPASEPWRHLWLGREHGEYASIVALRGLSMAAVPQVRVLADGLAGVQWVDKVEEISSVLGRYRVNMGFVVLGAYCVVFVLLLPRYRGRAWRVIAPTAAASVATLAILGYAGQDLQLFHVLALMLLLGVGVDYGIFMQESVEKGGDRRDTTPWLAVGLSAANTLLAFGLLGLSNTPALRAFGVTMLLGTLLVWLAVPCFGVSIIKEEKANADAIGIS